MSHVIRFGALICAAALAGCRGEMTGPEQMSADIAAARTELTAHHDAARGATSLDALRVEGGRHDAVWADLMADMMDDMGGMGMCGAMADMERMMDEVHGLVATYGHHLDTAAGLADGQAACDSYVGAMDGELDGMMSSMESGGCMMR